MRSLSQQKKPPNNLNLKPFKKEPSASNFKTLDYPTKFLSNNKPIIKKNVVAKPVIKEETKSSVRDKISSTGMKIINSNTHMKITTKVAEKKTVSNPFAVMPSTKYTNIKSADPFALGKKHKTNFGYVYSVAGIPCRIEHGAIKLKIKWDVDINKIDFDPILVVCFEGLLETEHPYNFASRQSIKELLATDGGKDKVIAVLNKLINPLRMALASNDGEVFGEALEILEILSNLVKDKLDQYVHFFLQQINKKSFDVKFKEKVHDVLRVLENNGSEIVLKEIKKKIPTYISCLK